jgi:hypothetical protein
MSLDRILLITCAAATWWMTGLIWFVQSVHYPLFKQVGHDQFPEYHAAHCRLTKRVVMLPMLLELVLALTIAFRSTGNQAYLAYAGGFFAVITWLMTFFRQLKDHDQLSSGYNAQSHQRLLSGNFPRALIWTSHAGIVFIQCLFL